MKSITEFLYALNALWPQFTLHRALQISLNALQCDNNNNIMGARHRVPINRIEKHIK